jgi:hypothetical protein
MVLANNEDEVMINADTGNDDTGSVWRMSLLRAPGDGNCLFHALARQLERLGLLHLLDQHQDEAMHMTLRRMIVDHTQRNRLHFNDFIAPEHIIRFNGGSYADNYHAAMRRPRTYGTNVEIVAFAQLFQLDVHIFDSRGHQYNRRISSNTENAETAVIVYQSEGSGHYDSTNIVRINNDDDDDDGEIHGKLNRTTCELYISYNATAIYNKNSIIIF